jgi:hypothetical protein
MEFDLASARPVKDAEFDLSSANSGFDLASAMPVGTGTVQPSTRKQLASQYALTEDPGVVQQFLGGVKASWDKGAMGLKSLFAELTPEDRELLKQGEAFVDETGAASSVGSVVGDVAKYAPMMALPATLPIQMAAGAGLGAAYDTSGDRAGAAIKEGALSGVGLLAGRALPHIAGRGMNIVNRAKEKLGLGTQDRYYGSLDKSREALQKIIGRGEIDDAAAALRGAGDQTSAQSLMGLSDPAAQRVAALDRVMRKEGIQESADPIAAQAYYVNLKAKQDAARELIMNRMAMGGTTEQSNAARNIMRKRLEATQGPIREARLGEARIGGVADDMLKQADELDQQALQFGGTSAKAAQLRKNAQTIGDWGYTPIDVGQVSSRISSVLDDPKLGSSENVSRTLQDIGSQIAEWVKKGGGRIDPDALYMKRKEGVNEAVSKLLAGADPAASKRLTAKVSAELKPYIDDVIEGSGAVGWKEYIGKYATGLEQIDRTALMATLRDLQKNSPKQFMDVIKGNNPKVVSDIMSGKAGIEDAVSSATMDRLKGVAAERARDLRLKEFGKSVEGRTAIKSALNVEGIERYIPNLLNRYVQIANTAMKQGNLKINAAMYQKIDQAMRNPKAFADLIEMLPPEQRSQMIGYISKIKPASGALGAAVGDE